MSRRVLPTSNHAVQASARKACSFLGWILWVGLIVGCKETSGRKKRDLCRRVVRRQIACLKAMRDREKTFMAELAVEKARIEMGGAVRRCEEVSRRRHALKIGFKRCLRLQGCQRFLTCYGDLFVVDRARRALREMVSGEVKLGGALPAVCRDDYLLGRLEEAVDQETKRLGKRIRERCLSFKGKLVENTEDGLETMVERGDLGGLSRICKRVARRKERGVKGSLRDEELSKETKDRIHALEKMCRDRWRLRSVHNRIARIRRLAKKGAIEKILRICRTQRRFSRELYRTGQRVAVRLGERFERVCTRDVPLKWLKVRLVDWRDKAGPATCRRAQRLFRDVAARYPHDPQVHVTEVWFRQVCGKYSKK